jgi:timeless
MEDLLALEIDQDLLATCSALGYTEGDQYYKGDECWECMKDLIRFLRLDLPETCNIRRQLGQMQTVQKDLLPILVNFHEDEKLLDASIKLLINLTQPALLCMEDKYRPKDVQANRVYLELNQYLQDYKQSFTNEKVMYVLGTCLAQLCNQPSEDRSPDDSLMVERILILLRNILHIPSCPEQEKRTDDDVDLHDEIIWNFHISGIDDLLIYICNSSNESQWMMHGLEIIFLMMREQSAARLATANTQTVRKAEDRDFELLVERERQQRKLKVRNFGTRHSRFGGTYIMVGRTALNDSENVLYHKQLSKVKSYSLDSSKRRYKIPKRRAPAMPCAKPRQTTLSVRLMLQTFSMNFLEYCYNTMMKAARDLIMRQHHLDHDETYYLWAVQFFMEFNRLHDFQVELVSETLTNAVSMFIVTQLATYFEKTLDYKGLEARPWSRRLHYALKACREVLEYIQAMSVHTDPAMRDNADIMHSKCPHHVAIHVCKHVVITEHVVSHMFDRNSDLITVFVGNLVYNHDFREVFCALLRNYEEVKSDKDYLRDLVETTHLFVKLLERYCKQTSNVLVQRKRRQRKGKKKKRRQNGRRVQLTELELDRMWTEMETKVVDLLQPEAGLPESPEPFDGASGIDMEEQKYITLEKVVELLHKQQQGEAVALFRSARTVWPDSIFGSAGLTPDDEHQLLKDTFMTKPFIQTDNGEQADDEEEEAGGIDQDEEEGEPTVEKYEKEFDLNAYISGFAHVKTIQAYCLLLQNYRQNSSHTNHCIIKMLHRVSIQCRMAPMLYHISVFKTLDEILNDLGASKMAEMVQFAKYIVAGFFEMAKGNPCMFAELLFWKRAGDVVELQEGYGAMERRRALKHMKSQWTYEQEEQLTDLYYKHKGSSGTPKTKHSTF